MSEPDQCLRRRRAGKWRPIFDQFLHNHMDNVVDILKRLFPRSPRGSCSDAFQRRTIGLRSLVTCGIQVRFHDHFEAVSLHTSYYVEG